MRGIYRRAFSSAKTKPIIRRVSVNKCVDCLSYNNESGFCKLYADQFNKPVQASFIRQQTKFCGPMAKDYSDVTDVVIYGGFLTIILSIGWCVASGWMFAFKHIARNMVDNGW